MNKNHNYHLSYFFLFHRLEDSLRVLMVLLGATKQEHLNPWDFFSVQFRIISEVLNLQVAQEDPEKHASEH